MEQRSEPDEWLMAQVAKGRRECVEPLLRRHAGPLLAFLRHLVGDPHRGEELFQEVFLTVWVKRAQYEAGRPFRPWLYAIALNRCREEFRRRPGESLSLNGDGVVAPADSDPTPVDTAVATERAALVQAAVQRLPEQQRSVVMLRVWQGLPYAEIAAAMDVSEGTVRAHMHHALANLRRSLEVHLH
jgi:RNA polymerase sigma-70 factor, ECF subfamily